MIFQSIKKLATYALEKGLITPEEECYSINLLLDVLNLDEYVEPAEEYKDVDLGSTLREILDYAAENKLIESNSVVYRDLFDTKVMNCFTPRPQTVIDKFNALCLEDPTKATDWYYSFSKDTDYVRSYRIKKDLRWKTRTPYGNLDITINLSKPEKDPKAIAAAKLLKQSSYPKCMLCRENEGYRGRVNHPARETIRIIPMNLCGDSFYLQYSPYSYYNEHCIVFNHDHIPMVINEKAIRHLFAFVSKFPHYMLGSNADLPIVGGSILTHDHYQGGRYTFPMFVAPEVTKLSFEGFSDIEASHLYWPLSVIRLKGEDVERLTELSCKIIAKWRGYTDESCQIFAETDGVPHSTVTPIVHKEGKKFVIDLALRNNLTTEEYPLGVYHPHQEYWNIKKENIGLIEVMGLAVLPSRLKGEMERLSELLLTGGDVASDERTSKHASWLTSFRKEYPETMDAKGIDEMLKNEIGRTFMKVLECAGVYKQDEKGRKGLLRFVSYVNER